MSFKLSQSERVLLMRRRLGLTQAQAARKLKMQSHIYAQVERNRCGEYSGMELVPWMIVPLVLQDHERCLIMRKRCGMTQAEVAKKLKCSRYWLDLMELGKQPCDSLLWFWEH